MPKSNDAGAETIRLVCLFFVLLSLGLAGLVGLSRSAFAQPTGASVALAWLHCSAVIFAWQTAALRAQKRKGSSALGVVATLAIVALPCIVGFSVVAGWIVVFVLASICLPGLIESAPAALRMSARQGAILLLGAPVLALVLFLWTNSKEYANVLEPELALVGLQHLDTMYHVAISSMLVQHGVVSTGLDGLVHTPYHALSHLWIGRLSEWLHTTPIHGYYLVIQIVGLPLIFFTIVASTVCQVGTDDDRPARFPEVLLLPICLLLMVAVVDWSSYLVSESYLLGMLLFNIGLPLLLEQARESLWRGTAPRLFLICSAGVLMALAKVSVGAIWFSGIGYLLIRHFVVQRSSRRQAIRLLGACLFAGSSLFMVVWAVLPGEHLQNMRFTPFRFAMDYPKVVAINTLAIGLGSVALCGHLLRKRDNAANEVLGILMATSWVLAMTMNVPGGSDYYFLNVGTWVAVVVLARWALSRFDFGEENQHSYCLLGLIVLSLLVNREILRSYSRMHHKVDQLALLVGVSEPTSIFATPAIAGQMPGTIGAQVVRTISDHLSYGESDALIFIPPRNRAFWEMDQNCRRKGLLIPALIGIPLLNGLPPTYLECVRSPEFGEFYGYGRYSPASNAAEMSDGELCAKARGLGYARIGVLAAPRDFRLLSCGTGGTP